MKAALAENAGAAFWCGCSGIVAVDLPSGKWRMVDRGKGEWSRKAGRSAEDRGMMGNADFVWGR